MIYAVDVVSTRGSWFFFWSYKRFLVRAGLCREMFFRYLSWFLMGGVAFVLVLGSSGLGPCLSRLFELWTQKTNREKWESGKIYTLLYCLAPK